jgi:hypothetical protein
MRELPTTAPHEGLWVLYALRAPLAAAANHPPEDFGRDSLRRTPARQAPCPRNVATANRVRTRAPAPTAPPGPAEEDDEL